MYIMLGLIVIFHREDELLPIAAGLEKMHLFGEKIRISAIDGWIEQAVWDANSALLFFFLSFFLNISSIIA